MITAVVLTHNDAAYLEKTLQSLTWCDELIVIDDESTDNSVALTKKYGVTVYTHELNADFAAQRNVGLAKAKEGWVLFVDSDEVVSKELAIEIQKAVSQQSSAKSIQGFFIKRTDYMWGRELSHGETSDVRLLRLAKKGSGEWSRPVHEVWNVEGEKGNLDHPLLHFPHPTVSEFIRDVNRYSTVNANMLASKHTPVYGWHILAYPVAKFIRNYFFLSGFKDGIPGFCMAMIMSFHSFLTRAKLYMHYHNRIVPLP